MTFIKQHWPAILASIGFVVLMSVAAWLVVGHWGWVRGTLK